MTSINTLGCASCLVFPTMPRRKTRLAEKAQLIDSPPMKRQSSVTKKWMRDLTRTPVSRPQPTWLVSRLMTRPEIFFDDFIGFLEPDEAAKLCADLEGVPVAVGVFGDAQRWRYLAEREGLIPQSTQSEYQAMEDYTCTVPCPRGCPEFAAYLSLLSQFQSFERNVVVESGNLETITHVGHSPVDCLVFPTSNGLFNPRIGVASCVHRRAGAGLEAFLHSVHNRSRAAGQVFTTGGFDAGVNMLVHCVGPVGGAANRAVLLYKTYLSAFMATENDNSVQCIAVASISTGTLRYPVNEAAEIALSVVRDLVRSRKWTKKISFVCIDSAVLQAFTTAREATKQNFFSSGYLYPEIMNEVSTMP